MRQILTARVLLLVGTLNVQPGRTNAQRFLIRHKTLLKKSGVLTTRLQTEGQDKKVVQMKEGAMA